MSNVTYTAGPVATLCRRIQWHCNTENAGGLLHGLRFTQEPSWTVEGDRDLPNLCIIDYGDREEVWAGGTTDPQGRGNSVMWQVQLITFMLSVRKKHGLFAADVSNPRGLMDWISRIRDAMDLDESGNPDASLGQTAFRPFLTEIVDTTVRDLSWSCGIRTTIYTRDFNRGSRKDLIQA